MKLILTFLLSLIISSLFAQRNFDGILIDELTNEPVPFATVYVNGTTNGTVSNDVGQFSLNDIPKAGLVIISHVSYQTKTIIINDETPSAKTIFLTEQNFNLSEIEVTDVNLRIENLERFKSAFLGSDDWGKNANLVNDIDLLFYREYAYPTIELTDQIKKEIKQGTFRNIYAWDEDSTYITQKKISSFKAYAKAPLEVEMPLLGYKLRIDLVHFIIEYSDKSVQVKFLGYYYFQPYEAKNKREEKRFENNRQLVYYNSSLHFLRALFKQKLSENGYKMEDVSHDFFSNNTNNKIFNIGDHLIYSDSTKVRIIGLKDKEFTISYFSDERDRPFDLSPSKPTLNETYKVQRSNIYFLSDTCIIAKEGTIPNNEIMFGGTISQKRVGSYLPENYGKVSDY